MVLKKTSYALVDKPRNNALRSLMIVSIIVKLICLLIIILDWYVEYKIEKFGKLD